MQRGIKMTCKCIITCGHLKLCSYSCTQISCISLKGSITFHDAADLLSCQVRICNVLSIHHIYQVHVWRKPVRSNYFPACFRHYLYYTYLWKMAFKSIKMLWPVLSNWTWNAVCMYFLSKGRYLTVNTFLKDYNILNILRNFKDLK